ncbi:hypothetical protein CJP74_03020 [Psittacicella melopsittaci]|uniref:Regulator of ribonuclease activity B domain-containing protein n=1 Tax=Psittacicella melopsittaci TaxID=2028576 RepID=A0A3A1Y402_9GAMM|nr:ribonuclease E inhibitor RraB [Psittacicella melopsittaci]RIY32973.1 hypothetical protein CJP74_03020 [Psittacicella melopsittaci]
MYDRAVIEGLVDSTIVELENAGTKPELPHIFLHHILFKSDKYIEDFIAKAAKQDFECDEPEYIEGEFLDEEDGVAFPEGCWNLDIVVESTLDDKELIVTDILDILNLVEQFPNEEVQYGLFGTFIETGEDDETVDPVYWSPSEIID